MALSLSPGDRYFVKYTGFQLSHERICAAEVVPGEYVICTPDFDLYPECPDPARSEVESVRFVGQRSRVPAGIGATYRFGYISPAQLAGLKAEGLALAKAERRSRGLPEVAVPGGPAVAGGGAAIVPGGVPPAVPGGGPPAINAGVAQLMTALGVTVPPGLAPVAGVLPPAPLLSLELARPPVCLSQACLSLELAEHFPLSLIPSACSASPLPMPSSGKLWRLAVTGISRARGL